jgi:hypothetical protein
MKSFIIACVTAVIIALIGWSVLYTVQKPAAQAFSTPYARV